jgi:hypothetical protein
MTPWLKAGAKGFPLPRRLTSACRATLTLQGLERSYHLQEVAMVFPANHMLGWRRNGVNHVSMNNRNFDRTLGPIRNTSYPTYTNVLLDWYRTKNVKSVRFMFTWEAVQSSLRGSIPSAHPGYQDYWEDLTDVLTRLLDKDIYVILCAWQGNTVIQDTDIVYDDNVFTADDFADFWGKFATAINAATGDDQRVAFDLINEPHVSSGREGEKGISKADWFICAQAAIDAIRAAGGTNTIFVPGMNFSHGYLFVRNDSEGIEGSSDEWGNLTDAEGNIAVTVHCYRGLYSESTTVLREECADLVVWARAHGVKANVGEIALDAGPNGTDTYCTGTTFASAQAKWADWSAFCGDNDDVIVGWNWWANSAGNTDLSHWWSANDHCHPNGFNWGLTLNDGNTQTVYMDLIEASLPVPKGRRPHRPTRKTGGERHRPRQPRTKIPSKPPRPSPNPKAKRKGQNRGRPKGPSG